MQKLETHIHKNDPTPQIRKRGRDMARAIDASIAYMLAERKINETITRLSQKLKALIEPGDLTLDGADEKIRSFVYAEILLGRAEDLEKLCEVYTQKGFNKIRLSHLIPTDQTPSDTMKIETVAENE
jgi:hypothetical protein